MRIVQLSEEAELLKTSMFLPKESMQQKNIIGDEEHIIELKEDETCVQLCIRMPGVRAKHIQVSLQHNGVLSICGHHSTTKSQTNNKRQRLSSREFDVDTQRVDTQRAMISLRGDMLILYAPKKFQSLPLPRLPYFEEAATVHC